MDTNNEKILAEFDELDSIPFSCEVMDDKFKLGFNTCSCDFTKTNAFYKKFLETALQQKDQQIIGVLDGLKEELAGKKYDGWTNFGKRDLTSEEEGFNQAIDFFVGVIDQKKKELI